MPYAVLEQKIKALPQEYYQLVIDYIDTITIKKCLQKFLPDA